MNKTTQRLLIGAAIASIVGVSGLSTQAFAKGKTKNTFKCEGGNACGGKGACGETAGKNACAGKGVSMAKDEADCAKMKEAAAAGAAKKAGGEAAPVAK